MVFQPCVFTLGYSCLVPCCAPRNASYKLVYNPMIQCKYIYSYIPFGPLLFFYYYYYHFYDYLYIYMHVELNQLSVNAGPTLHQPSCSFGNDRR